jgi:hypothetical protein
MQLNFHGRPATASGGSYKSSYVSAPVLQLVAGKCIKGCRQESASGCQVTGTQSKCAFCYSWPAYKIANKAEDVGKMKELSQKLKKNTYAKAAFGKLSSGKRKKAQSTAKSLGKK